MKLYATTTSERATKGQGGNEYLKIIIRDEKQQCFAYLTVKPNKVIEFSFIKEWSVFPDAVEWIGTNDDTKDKKQKTVKTICRHCGKIHKNDTAIC